MNRKSFSSFMGNEIALFVASIKDIVLFLNNTFVSSQHLDDICLGLNLWVKIFKFLGKTYIIENEEEEYKNEMKEMFNVDLKQFYKVGCRTFLSKPGVHGSEETFYMHTLRFYVPKLSKITFDRHGTGIGVFNMQGFERRNKESKNCMKRFSNNKGNMITNNLKRLWDVFEHDNNSF